MAEVNTGGSSRRFIVIGVIMIIVVVGGVFGVRHFLLQTQSGELSPATQDQQPQPTPPENAPVAQEKSTEQDSTPPPHDTSMPGNELPQTGPAETVGMLFATGILSATAISYIRSRRPELSL